MDDVPTLFCWFSASPLNSWAITRSSLVFFIRLVHRSVWG